MKTSRRLSVVRPPVLANGHSAAPRLSKLKNAGILFIAALREIFDESAYSRFLARTGREYSAESYRAFTREHAALKARQPKCC